MCREGGPSAAEVDVPAFEERVSEREARMGERVARMRERVEARGKDQDRDDKCKERMISVFAATYRENIFQTNSPPLSFIILILTYPFHQTNT